MKRFFIILLILLVSSWIGIQMVSDGYLLIKTQKLAIEMPLWLGLIGLVLSFIIVYCLVRFLRCFSSLPKRWKSWTNSRKQKKLNAIEAQTLFATLYQEPKNWEIILKMLPELEKKNWLSPIQIQILERDSYKGLLKDSIVSNLVMFQDSWANLPYRYKKDPYFINLYITGLIRYREPEKAEYLTRKSLKKKWIACLVKTYGLIKSGHPERRLMHAEKWFKNHPNDSELLLCLGRICKQLQLWGKAQDYLEASLENATSHSEIYQELGELFEETRNLNQAFLYFKKAAGKINQTL